MIENRTTRNGRQNFQVMGTGICAIMLVFIRVLGFAPVKTKIVRKLTGFRSGNDPALRKSPEFVDVPNRKRSVFRQFRKFLAIIVEYILGTCENSLAGREQRNPLHLRFVIIPVNNIFFIYRFVNRNFFIQV